LWKKKTFFSNVLDKTQKKIHWEGEAIVWHITPKMRDKYLIHCKISFDEFNNLVEELIPFLKSKCINWMRPQLEISKIVAIVLYRFVHGFNPKHMSNTFDVGASIIHKYVDIIGDVLCGDKFFGKYISTTSKDHLLHIIQQF
jgi:hypothetical protein